MDERCRILVKLSYYKPTTKPDLWFMSLEKMLWNRICSEFDMSDLPYIMVDAVTGDIIKQPEAGEYLVPCRTGVYRMICKNMACKTEEQAGIQEFYNGFLAADVEDVVSKYLAYARFWRSPAVSLNLFTPERIQCISDIIRLECAVRGIS